MSTRIIVVHAETDFLGRALAALRQADFEVVGFSDTYKALNAFDAEPGIELLITGMSFGPGKQNGISLALMGKTLRRNLKVLFAASPDYQGQDDGIGEFLPLPASGDDIVKMVKHMLGTSTKTVVRPGKKADGATAPARGSSGNSTNTPT